MQEQTIHHTAWLRPDGDRCLRGPLGSFSKPLQPPPRNGALAGDTHSHVFLSIKICDVRHEMSHLFNVVRVESKTVFTFTNQIWSATAAVRYQHRQAGRHG